MVLNLEKLAWKLCTSASSGKCILFEVMYSCDQQAHLSLCLLLYMPLK